jgi:hypothetical protein
MDTVLDFRVGPPYISTYVHEHLFSTTQPSNFDALEWVFIK